MFSLRSTALAAVLSLSLLARADDSKFKKDPRLHKSLWGMAYMTENGAYFPNCGDTIEEVVKDIQLLSQLTTRLRLYGSDCQQLELVLEAIKRTKTNLHVFPGIYIDGNQTTYERQRDTTFDILDQYGVDNILGITVGNEYLLQIFTGKPAELPEAEALLIEKMQEVRDIIAEKGWSKNIPVGTADAGSQITATLSEAADYVMANTHPFFSGIDIDGAAAWTAQFLENDEPRFAIAAGKPLYNAEVGWPTDAMSGGSLTLNGSAATIENSQVLLDTWVCSTNEAIAAGTGYPYFYFELFDAEWKKQYRGAEPFWGILDADRNLKDLVIPDCEAQGEAPLPGMSDGSSNSDDDSSANKATWGLLSLGLAALSWTVSLL